MIAMKSDLFHSGMRVLCRSRFSRSSCNAPLRKIFIGGTIDAFLEDHLGVRRQGARHLAADVGHVPEHRRPADQPPSWKIGIIISQSLRWLTAPLQE